MRAWFMTGSLGILFATRNGLIIYGCKMNELLIHKQPSSGVLRKMCSENTQQIYRTVISICQSVISIKSQIKFIEIILWHGCSPVNLQHIFRTPFNKNTYGGLLLLLLIPFHTAGHFMPPENFRKLEVSWYCLGV